MPIDFENDSFFNLIKQKPRETSAGPCDLPILYSDASFGGVVYRVAPKKAAELLGASSPFEPILMFGKALCLVGAFEYRELTGPAVSAYKGKESEIRAVRRTLDVKAILIR